MNYLTYPINLIKTYWWFILVYLTVGMVYLMTSFGCGWSPGDCEGIYYDIGNIIFYPIVKLAFYGGY